MGKLTWKKTLSFNILEQYWGFRNQLKKFERKVFAAIFCHLWSLMFCDASTTAYSPFVYVQEQIDNWENTQMLTVKTRVAPIKTLERLDLCAAVLGAQLSQRVKIAIDDSRFLDPKGFAWTVSQVTFAWIKYIPRKWKTFVANWAAKVQSITLLENWKFVPTQDSLQCMPITRNFSQQPFKPSTLVEMTNFVASRRTDLAEQIWPSLYVTPLCNASTGALSEVNSSTQPSLGVAASATRQQDFGFYHQKVINASNFKSHCLRQIFHSTTTSAIEKVKQKSQSVATCICSFIQFPRNIIRNQPAGKPMRRFGFPGNNQDPSHVKNICSRNSSNHFDEDYS